MEHKNHTLQATYTKWDATLFQQLFCLNNAIAKIDNSKLQIILS